MTRSDDSNGLAFERPGKYRIRALGLLNERWAGRLGSFQIVSREKDDPKEPITELIGFVRDQAELAGLLETLYELHLSILLVEYQEE